MEDVQLSLSTICGGELEKQFQQIVPALLQNLRYKQTASINIKVDIKRVEDTATMISVSYSCSPKFPAVKKSSLCKQTGDNRLTTEPPAEKPKLVSMFDKKVEGEN